MKKKITFLIILPSIYCSEFKCLFLSAKRAAFNYSREYTSFLLEILSF